MREEHKGKGQTDMRVSARHSRLLVAALTATALITAPLTTRAQTSGAQPTQPTQGSNMDDARARYQRGLDLYNDKNYEAARVEFARAYQLAPSNKILYNIGVCDAQLNDYVAAIQSLEKYLKQGGLEVPSDRREEVDRLLRELRPRIAMLTVKSNVDGALVVVDDVSLCEQRGGACTLPLTAPIPVNPGRRKVTVSKTGWVTQTRSLVVAGSEQPQIEIDLQPTIVQKNVNVAPYVAWGVTGLFAIGAGVTGYLALKSSSDLQDKLNTRGESSSDLSSNRTTMRTFGVTADILTGCAIVSGGVALYLTLKPSRKEGSSIQAGLGPGNLQLRGSF
jgi:hypothetical protein